MNIELYVDGMHCEGCQKTLERELNYHQLINEANADYKTGRVTLVVDDTINKKDIKKIIKKCGFKYLGGL